jgi:CTP:molybdopterin cytidylyltransferase MocA
MITYVIVNTSDLELLDYEQLLTTSIETTIRNVDEDKAIVKYKGDMPPTIESLSDKTLHNHDEIIVIVKSDEWRPEPDDA